MPNVTILVDGNPVLNRDVDALECEETAGGTLTLNAKFQPVEISGPPTGTPLYNLP